EEEREPVSIQHEPHRGIFGFFRRKHESEVDQLDDIPAYQRAAMQPVEEQIPVAERRPSIWERAEAAVPATMHAAPVPAPPMQPRAPGFDFENWNSRTASRPEQRETPLQPAWPRPVEARPASFQFEPAPAQEGEI